MYECKRETETVEAIETEMTAKNNAEIHIVWVQLV